LDQIICNVTLGKLMSSKEKVVFVLRRILIAIGSFVIFLFVGVYLIGSLFGVFGEVSFNDVITGLTHSMTSARILAGLLLIWIARADVKYNEFGIFWRFLLAFGRLMTIVYFLCWLRMPLVWIFNWPS